MNTRDFEYIIAIAELKSFSAAAKKCFVSQPALSQQIQKIENEIGVKIFHRTKNETSPTPKGSKILKLSRQILEIFQEIKNINSNTESIRMGLIPTVCPYLLPCVLQDMNSSIPNVRFYFSELKTQDLITSIKKGDIDIGVMSLVKEVIESGLFYKKLYDEPFLFVTNKDSDMHVENFEQILNQGQILLLEEGNCMSSDILRICSQRPSYLFNDFYATNIETVKSMIRMKNGAGLLPSLSCLGETDFNIFSLERNWSREICIVSQSKHDLPKRFEDIANIISQKTSSLLRQEK